MRQDGLKGIVTALVSPLTPWPEAAREGEEKTRQILDQIEAAVAGDEARLQ